MRRPGRFRDRDPYAYTDHHSRPYRSPDRSAYSDTHGDTGAFRYSHSRTNANVHSDPTTRPDTNPYGDSYPTPSHTDTGTPSGGSPQGAESPGLVACG